MQPSTQALLLPPALAAGEHLQFRATQRFVPCSVPRLSRENSCFVFPPPDAHRTHAIAVHQESR